jgi:hypothetical protein
MLAGVGCGAAIAHELGVQLQAAAIEVIARVFRTAEACHVRLPGGLDCTLFHETSGCTTADITVVTAQVCPEDLQQLKSVLCVSSQVEALLLCADPTLQRVLAMHAAPWFRAYALLQRCCPRLDLATYVERCASLPDSDQQLVRDTVLANTLFRVSRQIDLEEIRQTSSQALGPHEQNPLAGSSDDIATATRPEISHLNSVTAEIQYHRRSGPSEL